MTLPPEHSGPARSRRRCAGCFARSSSWSEARERYGETFGIKFVGFKTPLYFTSDPAATKAVYSNRANTLPPGRNTVLEPVMGTRSILLLEGSEHLARRKLMLPPFHGERMRAYEEVIDEVIGREIDSWPIGEEFRIHPRMQSVTLEVILRAVFGVTEEARLARMREVLGELVHKTAAPWRQLLGLATQRFGRWGPWRFFEDMLRSRRCPHLRGDHEPARRSRPGVARGHPLDAARRPVRGRRAEMSDAEVRDQLVTLLLAGHETTATALAWTFDLLLRHPEALERLRTEIEEGQGDDYLRATITESLRLRPVVPIAGRRLAEETEIDGYTPARRAPTSARRSTSPTPATTSIPTRSRSSRSASSTAGRTPTPGSPSAAGCAAASVRASPSSRCGSSLREVLGRCRLEAASDRPEGVTRRNITFSPKRGTPVVLRERRPALAEPALA